MKFTAPHEMPIAEAVAKMFPDSSKTTLKKWAAEGRFTIEGTPLSSLMGNLRKDSTLEFGKKVHFIEGGVKIYYEDSDLVIVEKPVGLLSVSTAFEKQETLHGILKRHYRPRMVHVIHRLDQETSGVMVFAFSERAVSGLKELFEKHAIEREYCAVVEGVVESRNGTFSCYLWEDPQYRVHVTTDPKKGRLATTHFEVTGKSKRYTRLKLTLETGRKNQIRVHCQEAGHPVSGDLKYGGQGSRIGRLALHAELLAFKHPVSGKTISVRSAPPKEFDKLSPCFT